MANRINRNDLGADTFSGIIISEKFGEYEPEIQKIILEGLESRNQKEGGLMGKIFGTKKDLSAMFVALVICILLLIIGLIVNTDSIWDGIFPIFAATIGYIFGKGSGKDD